MEAKMPSGAVISHPQDLLSAFAADGFHRETFGARDDHAMCRLTPAAGIGTGHLDYLAFNDDFVTIFPRLNIDADLPLQFADSTWVRMHFRLGGHNTTYFDRTRRELRGSFCNILRLPDGMVATEVHSAEQVGWVTVFSRAEFLREAFQLDRVALPGKVSAALGDQTAELLLENCNLPPSAWRLLREIGPTPERGALEVVRCEAMVTELICLLFDALCTSGAAQPTPVRSAEAERLHHARQLIRENVTHPPTIATLARAVGTNRTTLARGFRTLFGRSVFEIVQEERMSLAGKLLIDDSRSIGEIAFELGYNSAASFAHAFRKYWGIPPGEARRRGYV
jgi:AraC-like DNA-binding protein